MVHGDTPDDLQMAKNPANNSRPVNRLENCQQSYVGASMALYLSVLILAGYFPCTLHSCPTQPIFITLFECCVLPYVEFVEI